MNLPPQILLLVPHLFQLGENLVLDSFRVSMMKICNLPSRNSRILHRKHTVGHHFTPRRSLARSISDERNQGVSYSITKVKIVQAWPAASAVHPHDVLKLERVNVVAHDEDAVKGDTGFPAKDHLADLLAKLLGVGLESS